MEISCRVYKPRRARESPLFRLVQQHLEELLRVWPTRFARQHCPLRPVVERVRRGFMRRGLVEHGYVVTQSVLSQHHAQPSRVTITRRHHPLQGLALEVLQTGSRQLVVRAPDGFAMRLPRAWTDADGAAAKTSEAGAVFSADAIRALLEIVEALLRRGVIDGSVHSGPYRPEVPLRMVIRREGTPPCRSIHELRHVEHPHQSPLGA